jgi:SAM-dependent methyltransferase
MRGENGKEWTPAMLMRASGAYWTSCAVHSGVELGIFSALHDEAVTAEELARRLLCDFRGMDILLVALVSLGLLEKRENGYTATPAARRYLSERSPDYFGHIILHHQQLVPDWSRLSEAVRNGAPARAQSSSRTEDALQRGHFLLGMFNVAAQQAEKIASGLDLGGRARLLDLGGGPGTYAVHFCLRNPRLTAVIYDLPTTRPFAEGIIARYGLADRIRFTGGDFLSDAVDGRYDVVWISQVLHSMDDETSAALLEKAARTLLPGGVLLVQEFVLNDERTGPEHPALFACNMLVETERGKTYTERELSLLLRGAGASEVRRLEMDLPQGCGIVSASFPA